MKVLSLTQPWATLVALGAKQYETRSWATPYRGPLAIHASKGFPRDARDKYDVNVWFRNALRRGDRRVLEADSVAVLPLGAIICVVDLMHCVPTHLIRHTLSEQERAFGDYSDGRWAWRLANVRMLPQPIPARGSLGLWTYEGEL